MTPTGFELDSTTPVLGTNLGNPSSPRAANSGAVSAVSSPIDPDLARVVDAWPGLPKDLKSAILALLDMAP